MNKMLFIMCIAPLFAFAQNLQTIKATKEMVNIREDKKLRKNAWKISPEVVTDVFSTNSKKVTFYTDKDEITVYPEEGKPVDFIIELNGKKALTRVEYSLTYLQTLQRGNTYNFNDSRELPSFTYASPSDKELQVIRAQLKLDSIAGGGDEVTKIKNLMRWVHKTIRHDGMSDNPTSRNALGIIEACRAEKRGVNCRMLATVLNECYLAIGIKSRLITCMPKELQFNDCHVINMVYSNQLNKWLWMDPTFEAYVMDKKGNLLSVEEVRERLINGKPLVLNKEANWNNKQKKTKEDYLDFYMAKNLYRIQAPAVSAYNVESVHSNPTLDYIELVPLDGLNQKHITETNNEHGEKRMLYVTNNPSLFWVKP